MNELRTSAATLSLLTCMIITGLLIAVYPPPVFASEAEEEQVESSIAPELANQTPKSAARARKEMQQLLDKGLAALAQQLVAEGTFYPFAAVLGHDDEIRLVGVAASQRKAEPDVVLTALVAKIQLLAQERRIRAAAYFVDYVAQRQDNGFSQAGVRVELNHKQPDALSVFIPYSITADKKLRLLTPQYRPGKNLTFDPGASDK